VSKTKVKVMKAFIAGTSMLDAPLFDGWEEIVVQTPYGEVLPRIRSGYIFLQRHGAQRVPPHRINHLANIWALKSMKVQKIVAINSVGSLQPGIEPGSFVIPDDFFSPFQAPTFFDKEMRFTVPRMNEGLARRLHRVCLKLDMNVRLGGVYIQTAGPRLETRAEINFFSKIGEVIGMTLASEATLCMEQRLPYVPICSVDNYCNGIISKRLTVRQIAMNAKKSVEILERLVGALIRESGL
jgi:5'-methylthioadenosine phosphorylase